MKNIILIALATCAAQVYAAKTAFELNMNVSMNGRHVSSPKIVTMAGESSSISQNSEGEETYIEVIADDGEINGRKGILMKFVVGVIGKDGMRRIVSRPTILAKENEKAEIQVGKMGESESLTLTVIAQRQSI